MWSCNRYFTDAVQAIRVDAFSFRLASSTVTENILLHLLRFFHVGMLGGWFDIWHPLDGWVEAVLRLGSGCLLDPGGLGASVGVNEVDLLLFTAPHPLPIVLHVRVTARVYGFFLLHFYYFS